MLVGTINEYFKDNYQKWCAYRNSNLPDEIAIRYGDTIATMIIDTTSQIIYAYFGSMVEEFNYSDFDILDKLSTVMETMN